MSIEWCVMIVPEVQGTPRGAMLADALWKRGISVTYGFLDGDPGLCDRVSGVAQEWISKTQINLSLERRKDAKTADIRISFALRGSWSILGRYAQREKDGATMNFAWLHPGSTDAEVREVVLHEFGHALGFIHEHQNPLGGIEWNRDKVIESLSGPPNSWSIEKIKLNVLDGYDQRKLLLTPFDPDSIMLYPFPAEWTTTGVGTKSNGDLSKADIALARRAYGKGA